MLLSSQTKIRSTPVNVIDFLVHLDKPGQYQRWHPEDHIWLKRTNRIKGVGAKFQFCEKIGSRKLKLSFQISKLTPTHLRFEPIGIARMFRLGCADYKFSNQKGGWMMRASLRLGWGSNHRSRVWPIVLDITSLRRHLEDEERFLSHLE